MEEVRMDRCMEEEVIKKCIKIITFILTILSK